MPVRGGGGHVALVAGREGVQVARRLVGLGYQAFALIHRFPDAPHGFALDAPGLPVSLWPDPCAAWLRRKGFL